MNNQLSYIICDLITEHQIRIKGPEGETDTEAGQGG
jgi:hypothetical protein